MIRLTYHFCIVILILSKRIANIGKVIYTNATLHFLKDVRRIQLEDCERNVSSQYQSRASLCVSNLTDHDFKSLLPTTNTALSRCTRKF